MRKVDEKIDVVPKLPAVAVRAENEGEIIRCVERVVPFVLFVASFVVMADYDLAGVLDGERWAFRDTS